MATGSWGCRTFKESLLTTELMYSKRLFRGIIGEGEGQSQTEKGTTAMELVIHAVRFSGCGCVASRGSAGFFPASMSRIVAALEESARKAGRESAAEGVFAT